MLGQTVVIATEAEDEVAGLSDVDTVSDVLEEEGEAFSPSQCRHVALRQGQMSGQRRDAMNAVSRGEKSGQLSQFHNVCLEFSPLRARLLHQQSDEGDHLLQSCRTIFLLCQRQDVLLLILFFSLLLGQHLHLRLRGNTFCLILHHLVYTLQLAYLTRKEANK